MHAEPTPLDAADELQVRFLDCLRAAEGRALSFEQLRALGFENPATLCYELESAGVPLWRVERRTGPGCAVALGVRVAPESADQLEHGARSRPWAAALSAGARTALSAGTRTVAAHARAALARPADRPARRGARLRSSELVDAARMRARELGRAMRAVGERARAASQASPHAALTRPSRRTIVGAIALLALFAIAGWTLALTESSNTTPRAAAARAHAALSTRPSRSPAAARRARLARRAARSRAQTQSASSGAGTAAGASAAQDGGTSSGSQASSSTPARTGEAPDEPVIAHTQGAAPATNTGGTAAAPPGPASAEAFELKGHQLLSAGRYGAAVAYLRSAIAASGGSVGACATPSTQACLTYAYALFDLGRALSLSGARTAAIGELEKRLQIDNQRQIVQEEIARVRSSKS